MRKFACALLVLMVCATFAEACGRSGRFGGRVRAVLQRVLLRGGCR